MSSMLWTWLGGDGAKGAVPQQDQVIAEEVAEVRLLGDKVVPLMESVRRMTLAPAQRLERRTPAMAIKGRVKLGADADLLLK